MKKSVQLLILLGCVPFAAGFATNWLMQKDMTTLPPMMLIGIGTLAFFFAASYLGNRAIKDSKKVIFYLNLIAFVDVLLILVQELLLGQYWGNIAGTATQMFYLPVFTLGASLTPWAYSMVPAYMASFLLMVLASFAGCKLQEKGRK